MLCMCVLICVSSCYYISSSMMTHSSMRTHILVVYRKCSKQSLSNVAAIKRATNACKETYQRMKRALPAHAKSD